MNTTVIFEILSIGLIVSACLALFLDEAVYSVAALAGTFLFTALIYVLNGAVFAGYFPVRRRRWHLSHLVPFRRNVK